MEALRLHFVDARSQELKNKILGSQVNGVEVTRTGVPMMGSSVIEVLKDHELLCALALLLRAWVKERKSRKVRLNLKDSKTEFVEIEGYSADEVTKILGHCRSVDILDTAKLEKSSDSANEAEPEGD